MHHLLQSLHTCTYLLAPGQVELEEVAVGKEGAHHVEPVSLLVRPTSMSLPLPLLLVSMAMAVVMIMGRGRGWGARSGRRRISVLYVCMGATARPCLIAVTIVTIDVMQRALIVFTRE